MPFVTEAIWQTIHEKFKNGFKYQATVMEASWPVGLFKLNDAAAVECAELKYEIVRIGRNLRAQYNIPPAANPEFYFKPLSEKIEKLVSAENQTIKKALNAGVFTVFPTGIDEKSMPSSITKDGIIYMKIAGILDPKVELERLLKNLAKIEQDIASADSKLANEAFLANAPAEVIAAHRTKKENLEADRKQLVAIMSVYKKQIQ
jgi:valyl-tRNA synthetase